MPFIGTCLLVAINASAMLDVSVKVMPMTGASETIGPVLSLVLLKADLPDPLATLVYESKFAISSVIASPKNRLAIANYESGDAEALSLDNLTATPFKIPKWTLLAGFDEREKICTSISLGEGSAAYAKQLTLRDLGFTSITVAGGQVLLKSAQGLTLVQDRRQTLLIKLAQPPDMECLSTDGTRIATIAETPNGCFASVYSSKSGALILKFELRIASKPVHLLPEDRSMAFNGDRIAFVGWMAGNVKKDGVQELLPINPRTSTVTNFVVIASLRKKSTECAVKWSGRSQGSNEDFFEVTTRSLVGYPMSADFLFGFGKKLFRIRSLSVR